MHMLAFMLSCSATHELGPPALLYAPAGLVILPTCLLVLLLTHDCRFSELFLIRAKRAVLYSTLHFDRIYMVNSVWVDGALWVTTQSFVAKCYKLLFSPLVSCCFFFLPLLFSVDRNGGRGRQSSLGKPQFVSGWWSSALLVKGHGCLPRKLKTCNTVSF